MTSHTATSSSPSSARNRQTTLLLRRARQSSPARERALEEDAIRLNLPLARQLASRYRDRSIPLDDLHQVAYLGLVKAVRGFQPGDGNREFLRYAVPTIRGELRRHFRDAGWAVRPPRRIQELQPQVWAAEDDLAQVLHRPAKPAEVAEHIGVDLSDVLEACSADGCFSPSSLDAPTAGSDTVLADHQGEEERGYDTTEARVMLAPVIRRLGARDRRILELRYFRGCTQQKIGQEIGVTQMQVSRLLTRILRDLRSALQGEERQPA
ncbi:MAG: sigma-70 family RNA polymerase sigma factor [Marmoricola sp.]